MQTAKEGKKDGSLVLGGTPGTTIVQRATPQPMVPVAALPAKHLFRLATAHRWGDEPATWVVPLASGGPPQERSRGGAWRRAGPGRPRRGPEGQWGPAPAPDAVVQGMVDIVKPRVVIRPDPGEATAAAAATGARRPLRPPYALPHPSPAPFAGAGWQGGGREQRWGRRDAAAKHRVAEAKTGRAAFATNAQASLV